MWKSVVCVCESLSVVSDSLPPRGHIAHGILCARILERCWILLNAFFVCLWEDWVLLVLYSINTVYYVDLFYMWNQHCIPGINPVWSYNPCFKKLLSFFISSDLAVVGLSCGMWDLVPWVGTEPSSLHWKCQVLASLSHWTARKIAGFDLLAFFCGFLHFCCCTFNYVYCWKFC